MRGLSRAVTYLRTSITDAVERTDLAIDSRVRRIEEWLCGTRHATCGFAITRIVLGLTALGFLISNFSTRYYTYGSAALWNLEANAPRSSLLDLSIFGYFQWAAPHDLWFNLGYFAVMLFALAFTLGMWTRFATGLLLIGWVSLVEMNDSVSDQGDNAMRIALIILLFADAGRRWSWDARRRRNTGVDRQGWFGSLLHNTAWLVLVAQVVMIYGAGGLYKATGEPWQTGEAIYFPLHTDRFGPWPWLSELISYSPIVLAAAAWSTILFQVCFGAMLFRRSTRIVAILGVMTFHVAIGVFMGLPWFSLTMLAMDAVLISDRTWQRVGGYLAGLAAAIRAGDEAVQSRSAVSSRS